MRNRSLRKISAAARIFMLVLALLSVAPNVLIYASASVKNQIKVEIAAAQAISDNRNGAFIEWQSSFEMGSLGYNVFRVRDGEAVQINRTIIGGSVFVVGERLPLYGNSYSIFDENGSLDCQYRVEVVTIDGNRQSFTLETAFDENTLEKSGRVRNSEQTDANENLYGQREYPANYQITPEIVADPIRQRWVAAQPGVKFAVKTNGLYRVTRQQLADAGFNVSAPTANWQLYTDGVEQALLITGDNGGGVLGANGYIEFYGFGLNTTYTDTQYFYLVVGTTPGKRMPTREGRGKSVKVTVPSFTNETQCRTAVVNDCNRPPVNGWNSNIRNGETENWFGDPIIGEFPPTPATPANITINTPFVDTTGQAVIEVSIQGLSLTPSNHNITVSLNGANIGTMTGFGQELFESSFTIPASQLQDGANVVRLLANTPGETDLVNFVRIRYPRRYAATNNKLLFTTAFQRAVKIDNFSSSNIRVFDITDQNNVALFSYRLIENGGTFSAMLSTSNPRTMYALTDSEVQAPAAITANAPSDLYNTALNKDLIIVTYKDWLTQANQLADYRRAQGLTVTVANVEDVFDEFSYGASTPHGIKAFFERTMPRYALLFGDATVDPRNYRSTSPNYIPTFHLDSAYGEIVSDEPMGDFTGPNGTPDMVSEIPVGRLSTRNATTADDLITKITRFEQTVAAGNTFNRGVLFINDDPIGYDFLRTNQSLAEKLPPGTPVHYISRNGATASTNAAVRAEIVSRVNQGPFIVGYAGHGNSTTWTSANIILPADIAQFNNGTAANNKLSLFIHLTCLNGTFGDYQRDPVLSENLSRFKDGGAAAVWSSSGLTIADGQDVMGLKFYELHRDAPAGTRIGDLIKQSKLETFDTDVRSSWSLLGDPALKIK